MHLQRYIWYDVCPVPKEEAHSRLKPAGTSCFHSKFILFSKFEGFSNMACMGKLTGTFWRYM